MEAWKNKENAIIHYSNIHYLKMQYVPLDEVMTQWLRVKHCKSLNENGLPLKFKTCLHVSFFINKCPQAHFILILWTFRFANFWLVGMWAITPPQFGVAPTSMRTVGIWDCSQAHKWNYVWASQMPTCISNFSFRSSMSTYISIWKNPICPHF